MESPAMAWRGPALALRSQHQGNRGEREVEQSHKPQNTADLTSMSTQGLGHGWVCRVLIKIQNVPRLAITLTLHPDRAVAVM